MGASDDLRARKGDGRRVLIVEDNEDSRSVFRAVLEFVGYEVIEALTGREALERARAEQPNLILMDISLPEIDGCEATRILKMDEATRQIPIILLSAHLPSLGRSWAKSAGGDGYLAKPVSPLRVVDEVTRHLRTG